MPDKPIHQQVVEQQDVVNKLTKSISAEFTLLCNLCRDWGRSEVREEQEAEKVRYAIEVLKDMEDRCEKPRKILKEQMLRLENLTESPF